MSAALIACLPDHLLPWVLIVLTLLLLLGVLTVGANRWEQRHERGRLFELMERHGHEHGWLVRDSINGVAWGRCKCGDVRMYEEVLT